VGELFSLAREDRDAWAAIRGYVYQVDTTILRWLWLRPDEALELECGEDVDLLAPAIIKGDLRPTRTMEQIKCLDRAFTLRSHCSLQALVSFSEHLHENPTLPMQFRFVTTALPADERPAAPLISAPGIVLWQQIRANYVHKARRDQSIKSIAAFLQSIDPHSTDTRWNRFMALTRDPNGFADFVSRFEWSVGASGTETLVSEIEETLIRQNRASDRSTAKVLHEQLFVFTMRLLARRKSQTPKRVDRDDLRACLASPTPKNPAETNFLEELSDLRSVIGMGFADIQDTLADLKQDTKAIKRRLFPGASVEVLALHPIIDESVVRGVFRAISAALLSWPREISGRWLKRPELAIIETAIQTTESSCTVLLGAPGSGKSALLAHLGQRLEANGTVLLALKTDQLPSTIATLDDLDAHVGAGTSIIDSVREIAARERVVLLIDQLDALASLMDQKTSRLSAVLQLVYRLKSTPNIHLLISCREFDFRYDSRFSSLKADKVHLAEPTWADVEVFLTNLGIPTAKWPADMREMLRNPQHLCVFVENFLGESVVFDSYQSMLEAMFTRRVVNASGFTLSTVEASETIAAEMSDAEELWLPRASVDRQFPREVDRLISAGILKEAGRKIGFRHQTLFDYVRTRAFCAGTQRLATFVLQRQDAIFVRSTLWASLHALRSSYVARYHDQITTLWQTETLRRHLRFMLISFLGQVNGPDDREAQLLLPGIEEPRFRGKVLAAMIGNAGWFERLQSRLPTLMTATEDVTLWQVISVLQAALAFDRELVFRLMSRYWAEPSQDNLVLQTLRDLSIWDERAAAILETILNRQPIQSYLAVHVAQKATKAHAGYGARLIAASLRGALKRAIDAMNAATSNKTTADGEEADVFRELREGRKELAPIRQFVDGGDWYGLEEVGSQEPGPFVLNVWPLFLEIANILVDREIPHLVQYRAARDIELDGEIRGIHSHIPQALKIAIELFAEQDPEGFLRFTESERQSDLMVVHRLMSHGFVRLTATKPTAVLGYLTGDPRRFALGGYDNRHKETNLMIAALSARLQSHQLVPLERCILNFKMEHDRPGDDADLRRHRRRWNREHRLRLLRAFASNTLSPEAKKIRHEEEIALPGTTDYDHRIRGGVIGSPVSAEQMAKASNRDIRNLFDELRDNTRSSHPRDFLRGGAYQASQAFGAFAKQDPARALSILDSLEPGTQEQPAAHAFYTLAQSETADGKALVESIKRLAKRGFSSADFRDGAAWALQQLAVRCHGLDGEACDLLKSWLVPAEQEQPEKFEERDISKQPHSLLWSPGGGGLLPHGNYPILAALGAAYRCCTPPEIDKWLNVLFRHLAMSEHTAVWRMLVYEFWVLGHASDRMKAVEFLDRLFELHPRALSCLEGTLFLARSHRWLPTTFIERCLRSIEQSDWPWSEQAVGEISMLRTAMAPDDRYCREIVDRSITRPEAGGSTDLRRVGIAFACINLWNEPSFRETSHAVLVALVRDGDGFLPGAIMDLFRVAPNMVPDHRTRELLKVLIANPELMRRGGPSFLTERLTELLASGFDAELVAQTIKALLGAIGPAVGDVRTAWATNAGELIQLAVALQRHQGSRDVGLDIFETLMDVGAYEADRVLRDLDRRI
jgi:hypothetical protein